MNDKTEKHIELLINAFQLKKYKTETKVSMINIKLEGKKRMLVK